jgi:hypothetical protein
VSEDLAQLRACLERLGLQSLPLQYELGPTSGIARLGFLKMVQRAKADIELVAHAKPSAAIAPGRTPSRRRQQRAADRCLTLMSCLVPRRNRQGAVGDLKEDVKDYRRKGWSERQLCCFLLYQFAIIVFQKLNLKRWITGGAIVGYVKSKFGW